MQQLPIILIFILALTILCFPQSKMRYKIAHIEKDFSVSELDNKIWKQAKEVSIKKYWSGKDAPAGRQFKAKILWSDTAVYVRFEANQNEPLIVSEKPNLATKTRGLWDRDVCEIFLAPDEREHEVRAQLNRPVFRRVADLHVRYLPYGELARHREAMARFGEGLKAIEAIARSLT